MELTDKTFDRTVLSPDAGVWIIRFYAPVFCFVDDALLNSGAATAKPLSLLGRKLPKN